MRKWGWVLLGAFFLSMPIPGAVAPSFSGTSLKGEKINLSQNLEPDRGLLVCFWATWCVPCLQELQMLKKALQSNENFPVKVLTVNVDTADTNSDIKPVLKMYGLKFPVVLDPSHKIFSKYHQAGTLPFSVLIGPNRTILKIFNGLHEDMLSQLRTTLSQTLGVNSRASMAKANP